MRPRKKFSIIALLLIVVLSSGLAGIVSASDQQQRATFEAPLLVVNTSFLNVRTGPGAQYTILVTVVGGTELPTLGRASDGVWYQVATDGGPGWVNVSFTLPRGDFSNLPIVEVGDLGVANADLAALGQGGGSVFDTSVTTSAGLRQNFVTGVTLIGRDLRAQPDWNSLHLSTSVPNDPNTILPLIDATTGADGTIWYYVDVPNIGRGWTDAVAFRVLGCQGENVGVVKYPTPIRFDGIENRASFLLEPNTEGLLGAFTGNNNSHIFFQLVDGTVGFVEYSAIAPRSSSVVSVCDNVPAAVADLGQGGGGEPIEGLRTTLPVLAGNRVVVNTGNLNIRSGPSAGFTTVAIVAGGTELYVLGRAKDNVWYFVQGEFGQGWLNSQFVLFRGDYSTVPVITEPIIVTTTGTPVSLGQGGGGLVPLDTGVMVNPTLVSSGRQVTGVTLIGRDISEAPMRGSMHLSTSVPNDPNTIYPLLATQIDSEGAIWYLVDVPGVARGWMDAVAFRLLECGTDQVGYIRNPTPIRFDGFANRASFLLEPNTEGYIVGRQGDYTLFELMDGTTGLVDAREVLHRPDSVVSVCTGLPGVVTSGTTTTGVTQVGVVTVPQPALSGNRVVVNTGNLNIRSGPAAGFATVATVPGGTELAVLGRAPDGVWYFVQGTFGQGWLNNQFALFRGDYSTVPVIDITGN